MMMMMIGIGGGCERNGQNTTCLAEETVVVEHTVHTKESWLYCMNYGFISRMMFDFNVFKHCNIDLNLDSYSI